MPGEGKKRLKKQSLYSSMISISGLWAERLQVSLHQLPSLTPASSVGEFTSSGFGWRGHTELQALSSPSDATGH